MNRNSVLLAALAIVSVVTFAFAGVVEIHNRRLADAPAAVAAQTSSDGGQSVTWSATPINPIATNGNPKCIVDANMSASGATVVVTCGRYFSDDGVTFTLLGIKQVTLTASTSAIDAGLGDAVRYLATSYAEFETMGATHVDVRLADPSSGTTTAIVYCGFSAGQ